MQNSAITKVGQHTRATNAHILPQEKEPYSSTGPTGIGDHAMMAILLYIQVIHERAAACTPMAMHASCARWMNAWGAVGCMWVE